MEYKVRRLESELASGEEQAEAMKSSIKEREREMREIGDKSNQVIREREKLLSKLSKNANRRH